MIHFPLLGRAGRLGNQLWQIASTIGIAEAQGDTASFPAWDYQPFFSVPAEMFTDQPGTEPQQFALHIDERARNYLQDFGLWRAIAPTIKTYFQPSALAIATLHEYNEFFALEPPVLAMHVRRGDNATEGAWKADYHPLRPASYYNDALGLTRFESLAVFSDDPNWCAANIPLADYIHRGVPRPKEHLPEYQTAPVLDWIDLQLMTMCDSHIMSNSTYSWWAAFLSDDESPIYPWPWYGKALNYVDAGLMFPPEWRRVTHAV